jgi:hypothetical protein
MILPRFVTAPGGGISISPFGLKKYLEITSGVLFGVAAHIFFVKKKKESKKKFTTKKKLF